MNRLKFSNLKLEPYKDEFIRVRRTGLTQPNSAVAIIYPTSHKFVNIYYDFDSQEDSIKCKYISNLNIDKVHEFLAALFKHLSNSDKAISTEDWLIGTKLDIKSIPGILADLYSSASNEDFFNGS